MTDAIEIPETDETDETPNVEIDDLELIDIEEEEVRCVLCGWVIEDLDLSTMTGQGVVHFDRQCPKGAEKAKPKAAKKPAAKPAADGEVVVKEMKVVGVRGAHAECDHEATKSARAKCRKARAAGK